MSLGPEHGSEKSSPDANTAPSPAEPTSMAAEPSAGPSARQLVKPRRVLACVACQQRKVKCDRRFPCANCVRIGAQCVPAAALAPRQRRRRFPERELLDRLRHYESLLRQHHVDFEPMHPSATDKVSPQSGGNDADQASPDAMQTDSSGPIEQNSRTRGVVEYGVAKDLWVTMNQKSPHYGHVSDDDDDGDSSDDSDSLVRGKTVMKVLDSTFDAHDHLLLGPREDVDLHTLHPEQMQIFKLWQVYLDNVNPLLKITHTPTLQSRIVNAAGNVATISPSLEALMFSIYCIAVMTLDEQECLVQLGLPRNDLLTSYRFACRQALLNCNVLRSNQLDSLTAMFLYMLAIRPSTDPRSLWAMLGSTVRIAHRMCLHDEAAHSKFNVFEGEMRRRLWWALVVFDSRISEMSGWKSTIMTPVWNCRPPLNVNDFDLQPEMTQLPQVHGVTTEALFTVVRSEGCDYIRNCSFHLDFVNPIFKAIARDVRPPSARNSNEVDYLEQLMEEKYLQHCSSSNPIQYFTTWMARMYTAKNSLIEHLHKLSGASTSFRETLHEDCTTQAIKLLESDVKLVGSSMIKGFRWMAEFQFPFPAYIFLLQDVKKRPLGPQSERAWQAMSDDYVTRLLIVSAEKSPFLRLFQKAVSQAWQARVQALDAKGIVPQVPQMIFDLQDRITKLNAEEAGSGENRLEDVFDLNINNLDTTPPSLDVNTQDLLPGFDVQSSTDTGLWPFPQTTWSQSVGIGAPSPDWVAMHRARMRAFGW